MTCAHGNVPDLGLSIVWLVSPLQQGHAGRHLPDGRRQRLPGSAGGRQRCLLRLRHLLLGRQEPRRGLLPSHAGPVCLLLGRQEPWRGLLPSHDAGLVCSPCDVMAAVGFSCDAKSPGKSFKNPTCRPCVLTMRCDGCCWVLLGRQEPRQGLVASHAGPVCTSAAFVVLPSGDGSANYQNVIRTMITDLFEHAAAIAHQHIMSELCSDRCQALLMLHRRGIPAGAAPAGRGRVCGRAAGLLRLLPGPLPHRAPHNQRPCLPLPWWAPLQGLELRPETDVQETLDTPVGTLPCCTSLILL